MVLDSLHHRRGRAMMCFVMMMMMMSDVPILHIGDLDFLEKRRRTRGGGYQQLYFILATGRYQVTGTSIIHKTENIIFLCMCGMYVIQGWLAMTAPPCWCTHIPHTCDWIWLILLKENEENPSYVPVIDLPKFYRMERIFLKYVLSNTTTTISSKEE